jgi:MFS family permease
MLEPLRHRDFALLWTGMSVSLLGDGIYLVAVAFQAYELDNRPSALAFVGLAWSAGLVAFLLVGGVVADRVSRRRLMMGSDAARLVIVATIGALALGGALELWMLVALAFAFGAAEAFFGPAFGALVPEIVAEPQLIAANAIDHTVRNLAGRVAGPALGGGVVALAGPGGGFLIDAGTFAASLACLAAMRVRERPVPAGAGAVDELRAGLSYVRSQPWLWATLITAVVALMVAYGPTEVLVPYVVKNELGGTAADFGFFLAAVGLGWVAGSAWMGRRGLPERPVRWLFVSWAVGSLPLCAFGLASASWQLMALGFAAGVPTAMGAVLWGTLMQTRVPRDLRGRVTGLDWFVSFALTPVSFALTAPVAAGIGIDATFVAAGVLGAGATLALLWLVPGLWNEERGDVVAEAGVADRGGLHPDHLDALAAGQPGDGADHGQAVVAERVDRPAP